MKQSGKTRAKTKMRTTTSKKPGTSSATRGKKTAYSWRQRFFLRRYSKPVAFVLAFAILGAAALVYSYAATPSVGAITGIGNKCLDVRGNGHFNGNVVWLWSCNGTGAQKWVVESDQSIRSQGWCLDIPGASKAARTPVQLWSCNGTGAQKWVVRGDGSIMNPNSGLCLDDMGGGTADGNVVWTWPCTGGAPQKWHVPKAASLPNPTNPSSTPEPTGPIVGLASKCVDIDGNQRYNGNRIQLWTCHGGAAQQWTVKTDGTIRNGDWCLNVDARTQETPVVLRQCNGSGGQKWQVRSDGSIVNPQSGLCFDDSASRTNDGNLIWIWNCNGTGAQKWTLPGNTTPSPTPDPVPGTPTTPPSTPSSNSTSGEAMPTGNLSGWTQIFADDFTKDAPTGSWGSDCDSSKIMYTGDHGGKWVSYPNCFKDTYQKRPYRADKVLSVHNGVLDFFLHQVDGQPAGANPSPVVTGSSQYQTYGRYSARFKVDPGLSEYYAAWLLWPQNEGQWQCAESDFPEGSLAGHVGGFAHNCQNYQDAIDGGINFSSGWHTYTQEWMPGVRKYYIDNKLVGQSTKQVYSSPERWQLQTETNGNGNHSGHLQVDWVVVYKRS